VVLGHAEQHVNDFEPLGPVGVIGSGDFHQLLVFVIVPQGPQNVLDLTARDGQDYFTVRFVRGNKALPQRCAQPGNNAFIRRNTRRGMKNLAHFPLTLSDW
jgi:hypothetical protein